MPPEGAGVNWDALWKRFSESGRRSPATLASYRHDLDQFRRHYPHLKEPRDVHQQHLLGWFLFEKNRPGVSLATATFRTRVVCAVLRWGFRQELLLVDPCEGFMLKKPAPPVMEILSQSQVLQLLEAPLKARRRWVIARDLAVLEILYGTGIRAGELIGMQLNDVDLSGELLDIRRGKSKRRLVPMGKRAALTLERYLLDFRPHVAPPGETAVWLTQHGQPMKTQNLSHQLRHYGDRLGIEGVTPHALRRACATHLLENGANILDIQKLLGHEDLNSTLIYAKVLPGELAKTHQKSHPRARFRRG
jgi:site-specific recombinase XerD